MGGPATKILMLRNLIADYFAQDLLRGESRNKGHLRFGDLPFHMKGLY